MKGVIRKIFLAFVLPVIAVFMIAVNLHAEENSVQVSTYNELKQAIDNNVENISFLNNIIIPQDVETEDDCCLIIDKNKTKYINGNGFYLSANETGLNSQGVVNDNPSEYSIFLLYGYLEINNLTIRGGAYSAISIQAYDYENDATLDTSLKLVKCTIERSGSEYTYGGAIYNECGNVYLKDTKISRNAADAAGGIFNADGTIIAEDCSFNENRSLSSSGGGGAIENSGGTFLLNNCTIVNNASTEIGGAINNNGMCNTLLMNCTVVGNISVDDYYGGALGLNYGMVTAINTIFEANYIYTNNEANDVGYFCYDEDDLVQMRLVNSAINRIYTGGGYYGASKIPGAIESGNNNFRLYNNSPVIEYDGSTYMNDDSVVLLRKPAIIKCENGTYIAPLTQDANVIGKGIDTYLNVPSSLSDIRAWSPETIKAGYDDNGTIKSIVMRYDEIFDVETFEYSINEVFFANASISDKIDEFQNGISRENKKIIGASDVDMREFGTFTILPCEGIEVYGASMYGDTYLLGTEINITYKNLDDEKPLYRWLDCQDMKTSYPTDYFVEFELDDSYVLKPILNGNYEIVNEYIQDSEDYYGGFIIVNPNANVLDEVEILFTGKEIDGVYYDLLSVTIIYDDPTYEPCTLTKDNNKFMMYDCPVKILNPIFWSGEMPHGLKLEYTGQEQELIEGGVVGNIMLEGEPIDSSDIEFVYSLNGITFTSDIPKATNKGVYKIYVSVVDAVSALFEKTIILESQIGKYEYDMSKVVFENDNVTFDGSNHNILISGKLPKGVSVKYYVNNQEFTGATNAGVYTVVAKFTGNSDEYELIPDMSATLTITKATYDMSGIEFTNNTVTYDGQKKSISVTGNLPTGVTVKYFVGDTEFDGATNAGVYTVVAKFTGNSSYNDIADMTATLTITKATYDMDSIVFDSSTIKYDGASHKIEISGQLPEGVVVEYFVNGQPWNGTLKPGTYEIVAKFSGNTLNYGAIPDLYATLTINKQKNNTNLLWLIILLACLDLALSASLMILIKKNKKAKGSAALAVALWQITVIGILATVLAVLLVLNVIYIIRLKK